MRIPLDGAEFLRTTKRMTEYLAKNQETRNHFCKLAADLVALGGSNLDQLLEQSIWSSPEFQELPLFQRSFILGFTAGKRDQIPELSVHPKKGEKELPPKSIRDLQPGVTWHRHENGGGWKSETAYVEATAMIGSKAVVFENARVLDRAKIYGSAKIRGDAECFGACHVHGLATVTDRAKVFDGARVLGRVILAGDVQVGGLSLIRGAQVLDRGEIIDERLAPKISSIQELKPGVHKRAGQR